MSMTAYKTRTVAADSLRKTVAAMFHKVGMPEADAAFMGQCLVDADLRGVHSHGTRYTVTYIRNLQKGAWNPTPLITVEFSGERNVGRFAAGRFTQSVIGNRLRLNISPDLSIASYVQYDTESESVGVNTRLRWTFKPVGDLFIVFTFVSFAFIGLGLVMAMMADNVPAVQALGQCIFLPMLIIGGIAVPLASLPDWAQHVSAFFPGRYAVEAFQACVIGTGLGATRFDLLALLIIGAGGCVAGAKMFRWDAQQRFAARLRALAHRQRGGHDAAARVRERRRVRIIGLVGVGEHAVY